MEQGGALHMSHQTWRTSISLLFCSCAFAQSDPSLTIRFAGGEAVFHVGEIIPVELVFNASAPKTYEITLRNYDRSGRLDIEHFQVAPAVRDPLQNYFMVGGGSMGGGLGSSRFLDGNPEIMHADLNEWMAFDKAGHYSLEVVSSRVTRSVESKPAPVELRSNTLSFDIVEADPAWQVRQLSAALEVLNDDSSKAEQKRSAIRTLRFLDSPASIRELVERLGKPGDENRWDFIAGLAGSRYQELVLRELESRLSAPDVAITGEYLRLLAQTKFALTHDVDQSYKLQKELRAMEDSLYQRAAELVSVKQGTARAETVRTLLSRQGNTPVHLPEAEVAAAFLGLTRSQQSAMLQYSWAQLKFPAMVASLEEILDLPQIADQMLRGVALRRLHQLDPASAAAYIRAEIRQPHLDNNLFTVSASVLSLLPEETLPAVDEMLAERFSSNDSRTKELDAKLIGRYATAAILPRVKAAYEPSAGEWSCDIEDGLISYFLRVDPDYGVKRAAGANSYCLTESLRTIVRMKRWSEVEPALIGRMNETDSYRARQAAESLAKYGGASAEKALWTRLHRFHEKSAREKELSSDAAAFQYGLVEAIGNAPGWLLDNGQIDELERLTIGQERDNVKRWRWESPVDLHLSLFGDDQFHALVGHFDTGDLESARAKLAQYPPGTRFWMNVSGTPEQIRPIVEAINETAQKQRLIIDGPPNP